MGKMLGRETQSQTRGFDASSYQNLYNFTFSSFSVFHSFIATFCRFVICLRSAVFSFVCEVQFCHCVENGAGFGDTAGMNRLLSFGFNSKCMLKIISWIQ